MVNIPFAKTTWDRGVAKDLTLALKNRYFEQSAANGIDGVTMLARPGLKRWKFLGDGPITAVYTQPGSFNDALFVMSGTALYKINQDDSFELLKSDFAPFTFPSLAATAAIGTTPEMLWIADGQKLWLYLENGYAKAELFAPDPIANTNVVQVGDFYYQFTSGSVDAGTPNGSVGTPWLVALGGSNEQALLNLRLAINAQGTAGFTYSTSLTANEDVFARASDLDELFVEARVAGIDGNSIQVSTTITNGVWSGSTLGGGAGSSVTAIDLPDGLPAVSVAYLASFIIVVPGPVNNFKGRFFWVNPGETVLDPLNFATAERLPDPLYSCRVVGDQLWLFGTNTTEVWYATGDLDFPFSRVQGQVFDRGIIEGSDVKIKNSVVLVDTDGVVYQIAGGEIKRLSNHAIEEQIRKAIQQQS